MELPLFERLRLITDSLGEPRSNITQIKECEEGLSQLVNVSYQQRSNMSNLR